MTACAMPDLKLESPKEQEVQRLIERTMALHTSHIQEATGPELTAMADNPQSPLIVYPHRKEGWLIAVPEQIELTMDSELHRLPEELLDLLCFARLHGCDWLMLDVDSGTYSLLPSWDWLGQG